MFGFIIRKKREDERKNSFKSGFLTQNYAEEGKCHVQGNAFVFKDLSGSYTLHLHVV